MIQFADGHIAQVSGLLVSRTYEGLMAGNPATFPVEEHDKYVTRWRESAEKVWGSHYPWTLVTLKMPNGRYPRDTICVRLDSRSVLTPAKDLDMGSHAFVLLTTVVGYTTLEADLQQGLRHLNWADIALNWSY